MENLEKIVKHIEQLGFHVLIRVNESEECRLVVQDSILFVSHLSKIRKYLESNYGYELEWSTASVHTGSMNNDYIVLKVLKYADKVKVNV